MLGDALEMCWGLGGGQPWPYYLPPVDDPRKENEELVCFRFFVESVTTLLLFYVLAFQLGKACWDLSSPTGDRTRTPLYWEAKSSLDRQGSPRADF